MKRVQIRFDDELDQAAAAEAARRGISKAALIRASVVKELNVSGEDDLHAAWKAMTGWHEDGGMGDIDEIVYGPVTSRGSSIRVFGSV